MMSTRRHQLTFWWFLENPSLSSPRLRRKISRWENSSYSESLGHEYWQHQRRLLLIPVTPILWRYCFQLLGHLMYVAKKVADSRVWLRMATVWWSTMARTGPSLSFTFTYMFLVGGRWAGPQAKKGSHCGPWMRTVTVHHAIKNNSVFCVLSFKITESETGTNGIQVPQYPMVNFACIPRFAWHCTIIHQSRITGHAALELTCWRNE